VSHQSLHGKWQAAWQTRAACSGHRLSKFFPWNRKTEAELLAVTEKAKMVCLRCPVRADCLEWALEMEVAADRRYEAEDEAAGIVSLPVPNRYREGVFGGLDARERVRMLDEGWSLTEALLYTEVLLMDTQRTEVAV
jgi:hypothetical protein